MSKIELKVVKMDNAKDLPLPTYKTEGAAGMDLYANIQEDIVIEPNTIHVIPSGIAVELTKGLEAQIRSRSGLAANYGVIVLNAPGTIDSDFRGEIGIIITNLGREPLTVKRGDRIAQMVIKKYEVVEFIEVDTISETTRGEGGFGSTGVSN